MGPESEISGLLRNLKPEKIGLWAKCNRGIHILVISVAKIESDKETLIRGLLWHRVSTHKVSNYGSQISISILLYFDYNLYLVLCLRLHRILFIFFTANNIKFEREIVTGTGVGEDHLLHAEQAEKCQMHFVSICCSRCSEATSLRR